VKRYTYRVLWSEEDQEYIGLCAEFPHLSWLGEEQAAALDGVVQLVADVFDNVEANGEIVPEPLRRKR